MFVLGRDVLCILYIYKKYISVIIFTISRFLIMDPRSIIKQREIDYDMVAMGLPLVEFAVFLLAFVTFLIP
jgi:uncharacterized membrane protein YozB (DUF420 family)